MSLAIIYYIVHTANDLSRPYEANNKNHTYVFVFPRYIIDVLDRQDLY